MKELYLSLTLEQKIEYLESLHGYDLAELYQSLNEEEQESLFELLSSEDKADLLTYIHPDDAGEILEELDTVEEVTEIIQHMEPDDITDITQTVKDDVADKWIETLDEETIEEITYLREYHEDEAGAMMTSNIITITPDLDIKEAMRILVREAPEVETVQTLFVVDKFESFLGIVPLKKLIKAKAPKKIEDLYESTVFVYDTDDSEEAIAVIREKGIYQMPVVNESHTLMGMITLDDAIDVYEEEAIEDVQKLTGLSEPQNASLLRSAFSRIPWLFLLMILALPTAVLMTRFEAILAAHVILIVFQPLLLDVSGNFGTQTLSTSLVVMNADVPINYNKHIKEEFLSALVIGFIMGIAAFLLTYVTILINPSLSGHPLVFATSVGVSLFVGLMVSNIISSVLPKTLQTLGFDPANASGPLITTLIDVISVLVYYSVAMLFLEVFI